jgi:hypothetical protein
VICSDPLEHKSRVEKRTVEVTGLVLSTWQEVQDREYDSWSTKRIIIDTAGTTPEKSFSELVQKLNRPNC